MSKQAKMTIAPIERIIRRLEATGDHRRLATARKIKENIEKSIEKSNSKEQK